MRRLSLVLPAACLLVLSTLALGPRADAGPDRRDAAILAGLKTKRLVKVEFKEHGLNDVVTWLRVATGYNILVKRTALAKAGIDVDELRFTVMLEDVSVGQTLQILLEPYDLAAQVKGNIVWITTRKDALGRPVTRLYSIGHITYTKTDFIAPEINLHPSDYTPVEEYEPERIVEDDPLNTGDAVADLVKELVQPDDWDTEGWSLRANDRYLIVRAPETVQRQISRALETIASLK